MNLFKAPLRKSFSAPLLFLMPTLFFTACISHAADKQEDKKKKHDPALTELVEKANKLVEETGFGPGREYANCVRTAPKWMVKTLKGEQGGNIGYAKSKFTEFIDGMEKGLNWPEPEICHVPFTPESVIIDGKLDEKIWKKGAVFTGMYPFNKKEKTTTPLTKWYLSWDKKNLYVAYECEDRDLIAEERERDGAVYADDCVEIYVLPSRRNGVYWEIDMNLTGSIFDELMRKKQSGFGSIHVKGHDIEGLQVAFQLDGTLNDSSDKDQGYTCEVAIPFDQLPEYSRAKPAAGQELHFVMIRLNKTQKEQEDPEADPKFDFGAFSHQPVILWGHNIWNHGKMILTK
jgi:hypothetical protein